MAEGLLLDSVAPTSARVTGTAPPAGRTTSPAAPTASAAAPSRTRPQVGVGAVADSTEATSLAVGGLGLEAAAVGARGLAGNLVTGFARGQVAMSTTSQAGWSASAAVLLGNRATNLPIRL